MPGTGPTLDSEWTFLLAACSAISREEKLGRMRPLLVESIRWKLLFARADRHGLLPLLYQAISGMEDAVPSDEMLYLNQSYQTNLHKSLLLSRELIRILDCLSALGTEVMPYKGLALAEIAYGDIALRQSGDIDLLIHDEDLPSIRDAVRELGYTPHAPLSENEERAYLKSGYECAFDGAAGPNLLELQWAIQPTFYAVDFEMNGLFKRAVTVPVAGQPMKTPSSSDLFLILSVHAAKHVWGRLVWLCDLARVMNLETLDWNWIGAQARDLGIARIARVSMLLANRLLGAAIPVAAQEAFAEDPEVVMMSQEIKSHILSESAYDVESLSYFRLMIRLRERRADRFRFLHRLVFTPGPSEWKEVHLPGPLFPLYRLVRLTRLAARLVRA